jgi:8-oxo-dGTP diphosphatase
MVDSTSARDTSNTFSLGFMFSADRQNVLLIRKTRPSWQSGKLNGIGGHIREGESPVECMIREFREEAGIATNESDWQYVCTMKRGDGIADDGATFTCHVFRAFDDRVFEAESRTDEEVGLYHPILGHGMISNLPWLIPLCLDTNDGFPQYTVEGVVG